MAKLTFDFHSQQVHSTYLLNSRVFKKWKYNPNHISFSIWLGVRESLSLVSPNNTRVIGDGSSIKFWWDRQMSQLIHTSPNFLDQAFVPLFSIVDLFIRNG